MPIPATDIFVRLGLAFAAGLILGIERESHGRPAGLRTFVLVCIASAMAAILSEQFYFGSFVGEYRSSTWHPDPARLAAGILTGIGFLGAGVIVQERDFVRGVTTASLIWLVTILGLCFGSGRLLLGLGGFGIALFTLHFLRFAEHLIRRETYAQVSIHAKLSGPSAKEIFEILKQFGISVTNFELTHNVSENTRSMRFSISFKRNVIDLPEKLISELIRFPGVLSAGWK